MKIEVFHFDIRQCGHLIRDFLKKAFLFQNCCYRNFHPAQTQCSKLNEEIGPLALGSVILKKCSRMAILHERVVAVHFVWYFLFLDKSVRGHLFTLIGDIFFFCSQAVNYFEP